MIAGFSLIEIGLVYAGGVIVWMALVGFLVGFNDYKFSGGDVLWAFLWPLGLPFVIFVFLGAALRP